MENRDFLHALFQNSKARASAADRDDDSLEAAFSDDRLLRLAYADWLEEHGEPGAEYLRVEIALADLPFHDPGYASMQFRLQSLRGRLDPAWLSFAAYRYDLRVLSMPVLAIQEAAAQLGHWGAITDSVAMHRLTSLPATLVTRVVRERAEEIARGLNKIAASRPSRPQFKAEIVVSGRRGG
jgi:uncharacterized protein (TIGR02996 family)